MTATPLPVHEGGCLCAAVRYRVHGKPALTAVCHYTFCQRRLASAFAKVVFFSETSVDFFQVEMSTHEHTSDASSHWLRMNFCPRYGTTIGHTAEFRPGVRAVAMRHRIDADDAYFRQLCTDLCQGLRRVFNELPEPGWLR